MSNRQNDESVKSTSTTPPIPAPESEMLIDQDLLNKVFEILNKQNGTNQQSLDTFNKFAISSTVINVDTHERHHCKIVECSICEKQFSCNSSLNRHRKLHTNIKKYKCRVCEMKFFSKFEVRKHSITHIKMETGFDCPVADCEMLFEQHSTLTAHLNGIHCIKSENPVSCKKCNKKFVSSRGLLIHFQIGHNSDKYSPIEIISSNDETTEGNIDTLSGNLSIAE